MRVNLELNIVWEIEVRGEEISASEGKTAFVPYFCPGIL